VLARLVREFYTHLEVVQDEDSGIVLQSTVEGHVIQIDPQVINRIIGVPVLQILPAHSMKFWWLPLWRILESSFMLFLRAKCE
jgi:hypothetical protein